MEDKINLTIVKKKLLSYFKKHKEVLFAYIFGSQITKKTNKFSDIDIAIFIDKIKIDDELYRYGYQAETLTDIMNLLGTNKVDLVILNDVKPLLKHRVIYFGELIYSINEKERINFQVDTINKYMDYKMLQKKIS
ncbi:MAG: nucleotidyltransferase domain-containing protein [Actinobacteria bacterium]|nr:nucleotidyltransferase domain-containing protein [Actinomycetota bacterium]MBU4449930.1 nucleotidyltransferase domain-containing protein [Actinomycetota bacterium]MCG2788780.1 nucleotidyltransferase domain-containing protein [Actinomycetes bacterium]MCG2790807.1 nucleotidyltransferase domain-containing protein [Actinomycetes bacterium]